MLVLVSCHVITRIRSGTQIETDDVLSKEAITRTNFELFTQAGPAREFQTKTINVQCLVVKH